MCIRKRTCMCYCTRMCTWRYNVYVFIQHNYIHIISPLLQTLCKAGEHVLLVTQEHSFYRKELQDSKRQIMSHFVEGGVLVPPPPHAMIVLPSWYITLLILCSRYIIPAAHCKPAQPEEPEPAVLAVGCVSPSRADRSPIISPTGHSLSNKGSTSL